MKPPLIDIGSIIRGIQEADTPELRRAFRAGRIGDITDWGLWFPPLTPDWRTLFRGGGCE